MAIILKKVIDGKDNLELDSNTIIGIIGQNSYDLVKILKGSNIFRIAKESIFREKLVQDEIKVDYKEGKISFEDLLKKIFNELKIGEVFLTKKIDDLSDSERRILCYIKALVSSKSIIIIDEPFLDLDYTWKKKIINLIKNIARNTKKTIIICSDNSNIIYMLCKKVLLIKKDKCYYGDVDEVFQNQELLNKYNIKEPEIVQFVNLVHDKKIKLGYSKDIRDLIKEVYKSV